MEPITMWFIIFNIFLGGVIGFVSIMVEDTELMAGIQIFGAIIAIIEISPIIFFIVTFNQTDPSIPVDQISTRIQDLIWIVIPYIVADSASSAGTAIVLSWL
jgi:hypothetical protein